MAAPLTQSFSTPASAGVRGSVASLRGMPVAVAAARPGCLSPSRGLVQPVCKQEFIGKVVSNKADKTAKVEISRFVEHPRVKKLIRRTKNLAIHDPENLCEEGDVVRIVQCRPISKTKKFELGEIMKKREQPPDFFLKMMEERKIREKARKLEQKKQEAQKKI